MFGWRSVGMVESPIARIRTRIKLEKGAACSTTLELVRPRGGSKPRISEIELMVISNHDAPGMRYEEDSPTDRARAQARAHGDPPDVEPTANSREDCMDGPECRATTPGALHVIISVAPASSLSSRRRQKQSTTETIAGNELVGLQMHFAGNELGPGITPSDVKALRGLAVALAAWFFLFRIAARSSTEMIVLHGFFLVVIVCWSGLVTDLESYIICSFWKSRPVLVATQGIYNRDYLGDVDGENEPRENCVRLPSSVKLSGQRLYICHAWENRADSIHE